MNRPTRLRRPPLKLLGDDFIGETKPKRMRNKLAKAEGDNEDTTPKVPKVVTTKQPSAKGNLFDGKKNAGTRTSRLFVLQDRTNLPGEPFKADILVKKGADDETTKKTAKLTRLTAESAPIEKDENDALDGAKSSIPTKVKKSVPTKKKTGNQTRNKENTSALACAKVTSRNVQKSADGKNTLGKKMAKNLVATKTADPIDVSFVIESENGSDSQDTPEINSYVDKTKKLKKQTTLSRPSLTKKSNEIVEDCNKKSSRRSSKSDDKKKDVPTNIDRATEKKFFKTKAVGEPHSDRRILPRKKIGTSKCKKIDAKAKPRASTSFRMRQTTLSESFAKHVTKKSLRPRVTSKNYQEESSVVEKTGTNEQVLKKGPVYRTAQLLQKSDSDGSEIYEFNFNKNDSREKIVKKRKRKVGTGVITKKPRGKPAKKPMSKPKLTGKSALKEKDVDEVCKEFPTSSNKTTDIHGFSTNVTIDPSSKERKQLKKIDSEPPNSKSSPEKVQSSTPKPKILESVNLTSAMRVNFNSTPEIRKTLENNVKPLRTTNALNVRSTVHQYRSMLGHALLNKSLSPITKIVEKFDPGSPWRAPPLTSLQFSQIKNVIQSTPQVRKIPTMLEKKFGATDGKSETTESIINRILENKEENTNVDVANVKPTPRKILVAAESPRKFGTIISNVNPSTSSSSPAVIHGTTDKSESNRGSPRKSVSIAAAPKLANPSETVISDENSAAEIFNDHDDYDDKENSMPLFVSPLKSVNSPKKIIAKRNPMRTFDRLKIDPKENCECQPGTSAMKNRSPLKDSRILKQSNLNNFLNIEELPTSTTITTAHGIFSDVDSTPINGKIVKTIVGEPNVKNAFGFDDNSSDSCASALPTKNGLFAKAATVINANKIVTTNKTLAKNEDGAAPTRLSVGEIKRHLRLIDTKDEQQGRKEKNFPKVKDNKPEGKNKKFDGADFSDTFDELTGVAEPMDNENWQEVPLFADLEPVHFKEPPRHSYKRKRVATFNFSDHDEDEEEEREGGINGRGNSRTKKRKISKVEKQRMKMVEEWAKNLNSTFEEIDHFDLVVE